jgi:adenine-specific DNA methylase
MGAYYTDAGVARFLVRWALRSGLETIADPAFGGGVFLALASEQIRRLGRQASRQVFGVELDPGVYQQTASWLAKEGLVSLDRLIQGDFFDVDPDSLRLDVVVGNPPFIRYQRFAGEKRAKALERAALQGVTLSAKAGSWAAFVVHAVALLNPGGRMGLVVPAELCHAEYAKPVLEFLARSFEQVTLISFRQKLFPHLSQDTLLLLAEGRGRGDKRRTIPYRDGQSPYTEVQVALLDLQSAAELESLPLSQLGARRLEIKNRLPFYWIPQAARELYESLQKASVTFRLGQVARVGIGYVTGYNDFFHLSLAQVKQWNIPQAFLKPAVWRGGALEGLCFTKADWEKAVQKGKAGFLLHIPPKADLPPGVQAYLEHGQALGVPQAYKCRVRQLWYSVPQVRVPDGFLTYMSGQRPYLVANQARMVAPNSLHTIELYGDISAKALAALWQTSLTQLSAELEGHAMGGGMLKLEPSEASRVVLARADHIPKLLALADELDLLLKKGEVRKAQAVADQVILGGLGLTEKEIAILSQASLYLSQRRQGKLAGL